MSERIVTVWRVGEREKILDETHRWVGQVLGGTCMDCGADHDSDESIVCKSVPADVASAIRRHLDEGSLDVARELVARRAWEESES